MITNGKCRGVTTGGPDSSRGLRRGVGGFGLGMDKLFKISRGNAKGDPGVGTCGDPLGITTFKHWIVGFLIATGLTCVGCSSVAWF